MPVTALPLCPSPQAKRQMPPPPQVKKSEKSEVKTRETIGVLCILFISCHCKNCNILNNDDDDDDENDDDE